jgi:hypothetical protein
MFTEPEIKSPEEKIDNNCVKLTKG